MKPEAHHPEANRDILTEAIAIFTKVRDVPYVMGLDGDSSKLFTDNKGNCTRKHVYLARSLQKLGYQVRYGVATFDWWQLPVPEHILSALADPIDTHLFLYASQDGSEAIIDATWDPAMPDGFIANDWDGKNDTPIAVNPLTISRIHPWILESRAAISSTLGSFKRATLPTPTPFNDAMNNWLNRQI